MKDKEAPDVFAAGDHMLAVHAQATVDEAKGRLTETMTAFTALEVGTTAPSWLTLGGIRSGFQLRRLTAFTLPPRRRLVRIRDDDARPAQHGRD
jgi:hypothetical protein